ncbi:hypothetical protein ABSA28_00713 [Candidatus Hepatincolaceae symbiont of Richtersius coronifer]
MKNKRKLNYDDFNSPEDDRKVDLNSLETKNPIASKIGQTKESKEYFKIASAGFVWIFMFIVSFLSLFLIFKTPYYSYYNQNSPIVVGSDGLLKETPITVDQGDIIENPLTTQNYSRESLADLIEKPEPSANNLNSLSNNSLTTTNRPRESIPARGKSASSMSTNQSEDQIATSSAAKKPREAKQTANSKPSSAKAIKYPQNKVDTEITKILKADTTKANVVPKKSGTQAKTPSLPATEARPKVLEQLKKNPFKPIAASDKGNTLIWLVNIYSSKSKEPLPEKLGQIKNQYKGAFADTTFYFTEYIVEGIRTFRISLAKNRINEPYSYFPTKEEAKAFCDGLKNAKIDCFLSTVLYSNLETYKVQ